MNRFTLKTLFGPFWSGMLTACRFEGEGEGGAGGEGGDGHWLDTTEDFADLAKDETAKSSLSKYKTVKDALKGHVELQRSFRQSFRVPDKLDGMDPKETGKITERLKGILKPEHLRTISGAPDDPKAYELVRQQLPAGMGHDEQLETDLRAYGVKHGLSQEAMTELHQSLVARDVARVTKEHGDLERLWADTRQSMIEKFSVNGQDGKAEWERREKLVGDMLQEWGNKAGFKGEDIVGSLLELGTKEKLTPIIAALAELAQAAQTEGVTKLGSPGAGSGPEKIDSKTRWPASQDVMGE